MNRHKEIRRLIGSALDGCVGPELTEVRSRLEDAMAAARRAESRSAAQTPRKKWEAEVSASPMKKLTRVQMDNVLGKIEDMIEEEMGREKNEGEDGLIVG